MSTQGHRLRTLDIPTVSLDTPAITIQKGMIDTKGTIAKERRENGTEVII